MNKEDMLDVLIKAFGIYLLVLAIIAIPKALEGTILVWFYIFQLSWAPSGDDATVRIFTTLLTTHISSSLGAVIRFVIYLIASINFLRSGSWVRMLINKPTSHPE